MLNVDIFGHDFKIDETLNEYVESRAAKLHRYINDLEEARIDLSHRASAREAAHRYKAQITLRGKKFVLRSEYKSDQIQSAFDNALERIQRQIERYKGKRYRGKGDGASISDEATEEVAALYEEEVEEQVVRRKKFMLHPMNESEAIEQMRLLGHQDFFVFYDMEAGGVSVLYRRADGDYGLINTELA
ncbi:MAG TPA: ribosome-associated translation inhibitor RaiA [Anaerolineales bacterium]|nr:ribosome-associated translation inhibitor RaiA [Anaerolineales bacterium]HRQ91426.1 ribosome-associated translation inhibitor RaiA [Anaerolineales bacterium]